MTINTCIQVNDSIYLEKGDTLDEIYTKRIVLANGESVLAFN